MPYKKREDRLKQGQRWRDTHKEEYKLYQNSWRKKNIEKVRKSARDWMKRNYNGKVKNTYLLRKYGINLKEYNELVLSQNNKCAICKQEELGKSLAVDHNHETGEVRGLLCEDCNRGIGILKEDIKRLSAAIEYLIKWQKR